MFSFLKSEHAKLRDAAKNWLYMAGKVYHFRRDRMSETEAQRLVQLSEAVKAEARSRKGDSARLRSSIEALKAHMEQVGGNYYPRGGMAENVEFFFAAIIIYVGVTTFFVKPFKIPTNSMWPTYYGMTAEVYAGENEGPGGLEKVFRFFAFGAKSYEVEAPADGEVLVPVYSDRGRLVPHFTSAAVKRYFLINTPGRKYSLFVGDEEVSFKVPEEFSMEREVLDRLDEMGASNPFANLDRLAQSGMVVREMRAPALMTKRVGRAGKDGESEWARAWETTTIYLLRTGIKVEEGKPIVNFDLLTGDQLFVDRMSYHFVEPELGEGFVFKTAGIAGLDDDKFFIKRLCGTPGDEVRIEAGRLMVNGEPASGSETFEMNARQEGSYGGYVASYDLSPGRTMSVPEGAFLALGDNSGNSFDGRYWGYVPEGSVVGRPIMIYYPFTKRFGRAK